MERFTTGDGIAIAYHQFPSSADDGRPLVVLQHGFAADSSLNWVRPGVVAALNAAGRSVIAVDARGHGHSDKPHDPSFYGEGRMSQDLTELIDSLGVRSFDLVGYSMGAIVAAITATRDPRVRRLVLGGIGASVAELGGVDSRRVASPALAAALRADDASAVTDPVTASFRRFADTTGADRRALAAQVERVHRTAIALGSIEAPTLVLVGDRDLLATRPEVLVAAIPGARLEVIPGDHLGAVGAPGFAPAIVRFLAAADARGR
jgi:pimeloyl-ACP methyl ester carboxylesterase